MTRSRWSGVAAKTFALLGLACRPSAPPPAGPTEPSSLSGVGDNNIPITNHAFDGALEDAVAIETKAHVVNVDGKKVADAPARTAKKPARIDPLFSALQERKKGVKAGAAGAAARAAFKFERDEPALTVKSVLVTAAQAGFPSPAFIVRRPSGKDGGGYIPGYLNAEVPTTKDSAATAPGDRELHLHLSARGVVLVKWMEKGKQLGEVLPSEAQIAKLATTIERGWNEKGLHREPNDKRLDQAIIHVDDDTPFALLVVVLDALHATKRKIGDGAGVAPVPVLTANILATD